MYRKYLTFRDPPAHTNTTKFFDEVYEPVHNAKPLKIKTFDRPISYADEMGTAKAIHIPETSRKYSFMEVDIGAKPKIVNYDDGELMKYTGIAGFKPLKEPNLAAAQFGVYSDFDYRNQVWQEENGIKTKLGNRIRDANGEKPAEQPIEEFKSDFESFFKMYKENISHKKSTSRQKPHSFSDEVEEKQFGLPRPEVKPIEKTVQESSHSTPVKGTSKAGAESTPIDNYNHQMQVIHEYDSLNDQIEKMERTEDFNPRQHIVHINKDLVEKILLFIEKRSGAKPEDLKTANQFKKALRSSMMDLIPMAKSAEKLTNMVKHHISTKRKQKETAVAESKTSP